MAKPPPGYMDLPRDERLRLALLALGGLDLPPHAPNYQLAHQIANGLDWWPADPGATTLPPGGPATFGEMRAEMRAEKRKSAKGKQG